MKHHREVSRGSLFYLEQWIAFLIGIACLAVFLWTALDRYEAFATWRSSHFSTATLVSLGWLLTIALGLIGVTLVRFAFHKDSEAGPDALLRSERTRTASSDQTEPSSTYVSNAANRRRR